jgi:predicted nucleotide-binding protein (sugar kinase/HSP70/actin superfamily)
MSLLLLLLGMAHLFLILLNYKLKSLLSKKIVLATHNDYTKLILAKDTIKEMVLLLDKLNASSNIFFLVRPFVNQGKIAHKNLLLGLNNIDAALITLDTISYPGDFFNHVSQEALWNNRSNAYNYLA